MTPDRVRCLAEFALATARMRVCPVLIDPIDYFGEFGEIILVVVMQNNYKCKSFR